MSFLQNQLRRGTAAEWTAANPILLDGELGWEKDTKRFKVGDGTSTWTALAYGGIKGDTGAASTVAGPSGNNGWSPLLALVVDGERRVLQVTDWTGGTAGTKPATGQYVTATGLSATLANAIDVRGATGATGPAGGVNVVAKTAAYTAANFDVVLASGTFTVTLPAVAVSAQVSIKNTGTGTVTVSRGGATALIDGAATAALRANASITVVSDGTNWFII